MDQTGLVKVVATAAVIVLLLALNWLARRYFHPDSYQRLNRRLLIGGAVILLSLLVAALLVTR
ncbi:MAG: hypothetical protein D6786_04635 [Gammaproteobacteria bacterium]|nr:MAG: hypothetical protein D6786_04635 [Gammaproteobacteria bacterium]